MVLLLLDSWFNIVGLLRVLPSVFFKCHFLSSGLRCFWWSQLLSLFPGTCLFFLSLAAFEIFTFLTVFGNFIITCFFVVFFVFILFGLHSASWICVFIISIRLGNCLSVISSNIFLFSLPLFLEPQFTHLLDRLHYHKGNQESAFSCWIHFD